MGKTPGAVGIRIMMTHRPAARAYAGRLNPWRAGNFGFRRAGAVKRLGPRPHRAHTPHSFQRIYVVSALRGDAIGEELHERTLLSRCHSAATTDRGRSAHLLSLGRMGRGK